MRPVLMVRAQMGQHSRFLGESAAAGKPILQPTLMDDAGEWRRLCAGRNDGETFISREQCSLVRTTHWT